MTLEKTKTESSSKKIRTAWGSLGEIRRVSHKLLWACCGGILPIFVLNLDPVIFKTGIPFTGGQYNQGWYPILGKIRVFFYGLVGLGVGMLMVFLIFKKLPPVVNAALSGLFTFGAIIALPFGPLLLSIAAPPTLGLFFLIIAESLLTLSLPFQGGLTRDTWTFLYFFLAPFLAGLLTLPIIMVYAQTAITAGVRAAQTLKKVHILLIMVFSCVLFVAIAAGLQTSANAYSNYWMNRLIANKEEIDLQAVNAMKWAFWCTRACYDDLKTAYKQTDNADEKQRLAEIYDLIKEKDIRHDIW